MKKFTLRRAVPLCAAAALCLNLTACGSGGTGNTDTVAVQSVSMLTGLDMSGVNRYSGVAEAKSTQKVPKDADKTVEECCVEVGQEVHKGDVLFRYDVEALQLSVETAQLEAEQLENSISNYASQISQLEKERKSAGKSDKLSYTIQIQEAQLDQAEAEYNLKKKQAEVKKLEKSAENAEVTSSVDGVIQSISEDGSSDMGYSGESSDGSSTYITIMETGTYRIKGTASEMNIYSLYEEMPVTVLSRTDSSQLWKGTISEIDTGSTDDSDNSDQGYYDEGSSGESTTKYSFYVTLEDSEGMMMGQHVYILPGETGPDGALLLPASYIVDADSNAFVWAAGKHDTLEKRAVTLGDYDEVTDSYAITDGLTLDDYIAVPEDSLAEGDAVTKYDASSYSFGEDAGDSSAVYEEGAIGEEVYSEDPIEDMGDSSGVFQGDVESLDGADTMEG